MYTSEILTYDDGLLIKRMCFNFTEEFEYYEDGKVKKKTYSENSNSKSVFLYSPNGNILLIKNFESDKNTGLVEYIYHENQLLKMNTYSIESGIKTLTDYVEYIYEENLLITEKNYSIYDQKLTWRQIIDFTYNSFGKISSKRSDYNTIIFDPIYFEQGMPDPITLEEYEYRIIE